MAALFDPTLRAVREQHWNQRKHRQWQPTEGLSSASSPPPWEECPPSQRRSVRALRRDEQSQYECHREGGAGSVGRSPSSPALAAAWAPLPRAELLHVLRLADFDRVGLDRRVLGNP
jgi:hypothetical protein